MSEPNRNPCPALALASAWLDAELYMRTGRPATEHSARLMGFEDASRPAEGLPPAPQRDICGSHRKQRRPRS